jgi:hypothetical protein
MNASRHGGVLNEDYCRDRPTPGKTMSEEFAKAFAAAFNPK